VGWTLELVYFEEFPVGWIINLNSL
jgi:hypothetical protein